MKLSAIFDGIPTLSPLGDLSVSELCCDTRKLSSGCLFVCIKGDNFDAHTHAAQVLKDGAAAVVVERDLGLENQIIVESTRDAWGKMCANFFGNPSKEIKLIGITGTNGKTTTSFLIKQILEALGKKVGLIGTVQNMIGEEVLPAKYTTPEAYELQKLFRQMVNSGCEYCVMEVSSQALAQGRVSGCTFTVSALTNITQDHLDYHKTFENYCEAKRILFDHSELAVINVDDDNVNSLSKSFNCKVVSFAVETDMSDYTAKNIKLKADKVSYEMVCLDGIGRVVCHIPALFSVYNSLCAAVCCVQLGFSFDSVVRAIALATGVKGRMEVLKTDTPYTVIIDYAHTPDSIKSVIKSLKKITDGRVITLFGCGGDRDKTKRPLMGEIAATYSDLLIITSDNPRSENPMQIINDIVKGVKKTKKPFEVVENRREAIALALAQAKPGDIVLLAGKGHETYQILQSGAVHFDEREVVEEILSNA